MGTPYLWVGAVRMISLRERLSLLRLQRLFILALNTPSPFPEEGGELGDGNERTGDEAPSRRERSETVDSRRNPGDGKGSGGRREDSLHDPDRYNGDRIHDFVVAIMIHDGLGVVRHRRTRSLRRSVISQRMLGQDRTLSCNRSKCSRRSDGLKA
jgi:hypothetical protein